jgi:hypothetical protein
MNTNATPPAFSAPRSIDLVETAKLVRKHLAATFPGQKFTVRTSRFSMGSSIDVGWVDGPTASQVDAIIDAFAYGGFDGSIDLAYSVSSWYCAEHGASIRHTAGTQDSRGANPAIDEVSCCLGAEPVSFGAKFVHGQRTLSPDFRALLENDIEVVTGETYAPNQRYEATVLPRSYEDAGKLIACKGSSEYGSDLVWQLAATTAVTPEREIVRVVR